MAKHINSVILKIIFTLLFILSVAGCNSSDNSPDLTYKQAYPVPICDVSFFDNGYALRGGPDENGMVVSTVGLTCYVDYGTKTVVPMCSKPNCDHSSNDCAAAKQCDRFIIYNNSFYRIFDSPERNSEGEVVTNIEVAVSDLDGTNEKTIAKFEGEILGMSSAPRESTMFIYDGSLYILSVKLESENGVSNDYGESSLYSVSLESGNVKKIGTIEKNYNAFVTFIGATEEKAYFYATYREEEIKSTDFETIEEYLEAVSNATYTKANISVNLLDGTTESFELPDFDYQYRIFANCYFYSDNSNFYKLNLLDNTTEVIHQHPCDDYYYLTDDYLFFDCESESQEYVYNMKDKSIKEVPKRTDSFYFRPIKIKDGYCYGTALGFPGYEHTSVMVYCSEKDYFEKQNCDLHIMQYKG